MIFSQQLFKERLPLLNRALDAYALRQRTIAKNIANSTSVNYRPENVKFEELFHQPQVVASGSLTNEQHIPIGIKDRNDLEPEVGQTPIPKPEIFFSGESHVNIDKEMADLAQNQIKFRFASRTIKSYFTTLQNAITGMSR